MHLYPTTCTSSETLGRTCFGVVPVFVGMLYDSQPTVSLRCVEHQADNCDESSFGEGKCGCGQRSGAWREEDPGFGVWGGGAGVTAEQQSGCAGEGGLYPTSAVPVGSL